MISIVFITHCPDKVRYAHLRYSIYSLLESLEGDYEIIVVDNSGSDKKSSTFFKRLKDKITYIPLDKNYGIGRATNIGLDNCNGDYLSIVGNDMVYKRGWASDCIEILEKYPNEKIVATSFYSHDKFKLKYRMGFTEDGYEMRKKVSPSGWVFRKSDMEEMGRWNEKSHKPGVPYAIKLRKKGFYFIRTKTQKVFHMGVHERTYNPKTKYFYD